VVSNDRPFSDVDLDWTSSYRCWRFPVDCPGPEYVERSDDNTMSRRRSAEGPLDDSQTSLRLSRHEVTGEIQIIEILKEWSEGCSMTRRTSYTKTD
jgi:hypothetical protein